MKKLYRKGQVHPSPSPSPSPSPPSSSTSPNLDHQFSLNYLPAAILTLAASLSSEDKQVLAYLLSCSSNTPFDFDPSKSSSSSTSSKKLPQNNNNLQHPPSFSCYCFSCYTSYWARWDSSPNRQLIHEIIDAFEDNLVSQRKKKKQGLSRKEKRKKNNNIIKGLSLDAANDVISANGDCSINHQSDEGSGLGRGSPDLGGVDPVDEVEDDEKLCDETGEKQGSSVRKIVSFIGDKIWGSVWG